MKLKLVFLLALVSSSLILSSTVIAISNDAEILELELQDTTNMTWPMLPGENLNDIARLFYPKNQAMQHQFITKTLRLNQQSQSNLNSATHFTAPTLLVIPTLKSLAYSKHKSNTSRKKPRIKKLQLSYDIGQEVAQMPAKLLQDYEWLISKNVFLKEELAKLNKKIVLLQTKLNNLKLIFDKTLNLGNMGLPSPVSPSPVSSSPVLPNIVSPNTVSPNIDSPATQLPASSKPIKKVFKNLSHAKFEIDLEGKKSAFVETNATQNLMLIILIAAILLVSSALALKK